MGALPWVVVAAVVVWAMTRRKPAPGPSVSATPAAEDVGGSLAEQTAGRVGMETAAIKVGAKYGILGVIIGWIVAKIAEAFIDPDSPSYNSMGLPCSPWLTTWTETGDAVIRIPDQSGVDGVDVTIPAAWLEQQFPGNAELVGVSDSGMLAWTPGASSPVQAALLQACPWLLAWEQRHLATYFGYTVPGWGHDEFPDKIEWERLLHAHPFRYKGPHNASQLIIACRRLAFFYARDGAVFGNWLRDLLLDKLDTDNRPAFDKWLEVVPVLFDACHHLGVNWDQPTGDAKKKYDRVFEQLPMVDKSTTGRVLRYGPSDPAASYDGKDHWPDHTYRSPAEGFPGAWRMR